MILGAAAAIALLIGTLCAWARLSNTLIAAIEGLLLLGALIFIGVKYGRQVAKGLREERDVARWLDGLLATETAGAVSLQSAVELIRDQGQYGESPTLANEAIDQAFEHAKSTEAQNKAETELKTGLKRKTTPALIAFVLLGGAAFFLPQQFRTAVAAITSTGTLKKALKRVPPEPRLGDIRLSYTFPGYAERAQRTVKSPNGHIRALPGTEVVIQTRARQEVAKATLLVSHGEDSESSKINVEVDGRRLKTKLVVTRSGRYRFRLTSAAGKLFEEQRGHEIELELDEPPEITLLEPTESPLEVNENDRLPLRFRASDDFALGEVAVAWRVLGTAREGRARLTSASSGLRRYSGNAQLDLSQLSFKPGDRVAYSLEVRDNDTVSGPKVGASETKELRIYSKKAHHQQVLALQEKALDELVHILGDNLERPFDALKTSYDQLLKSSAKIVERARAANDLLVKTIEAVKKDPMGRPQVAAAFEQARKQLRNDTRRKKRALKSAQRAFGRSKKPQASAARGVRKAQDRMVASLEKNVVYLADLLNDQRLIDAESLAKELREQQQALKQALQDYKNAPTEEKRKLIAQAIEDIKSRIREIMREMSKLKSSIPQDFVNSDALESKSGEKDMNNLEKMLEEGNLDKAMESLERMLSQTEKMLAQLQDGREEMQGREYSEITEQANKLWDDLQKLEKKERKLANKTESLSKKVLDRMKERLGDAEDFAKKQVKRLEQVQKSLEKIRPDRVMPDADLFELTERRIDDGKRALKAQDFGAAKEVLEKGAMQMHQLEQEARRRSEHSKRFGDYFGMGENADQTERELRKSKPIVEEVLKDIEKLMPSPESLLSEQEKKELEQLAKQQQQLRNQAKQLGKDLDQLGQQLPIVGPEVKKKVQEAQEAMSEAGQKLGKSDAPSALNQERRALDSLQQLKQELEKMGEQGQGGQGGGVPLPFGQPQGSGARGQGGRDPRSTEKVAIPKPEEYKAPAEFREDILEAAKQGTVEAYKDAVRQYYEELVK